MIGIVVVSHSHALGAAAVGLATEMVEQADLPKIALAAGLDETTFGTDASAVAAAIEEVAGDDGVLVLLDLGSAVLSAEMALEFIDPAVAERVVVSSAPLVEGLVAAVVTAATGASLDAVAAEAQAGLVGKQDHLGGPDNDPGQASMTADRSPAAGTPTAMDGAPETSVEVRVGNEHGLHARPAAKLVAAVRSFDATATLTNLRTGKGPVNAGSLSRVATLDARQGDRVRVAASGPQAAELLAAVESLAADNWGDEAGDPAAADPSSVRRRTGSGLDVAIGPAVVSEASVDTSGYLPGDPGKEQARSDEAAADAVRWTERLRDAARTAAGPEAAAIFDAHLVLLTDPEVVDDVRRSISSGRPATQAWSTRLEELAAQFESLPDAYQRARAEDVRSVERLLLRQLLGEPAAETSTSAGILLVPELDAATATTVDVDVVEGIATIAGGATGHGVIVAKSRGIPIITDVGDAAAKVRTGTLVAFDARTRRFEVDPDGVVQAEMRALISARTGERTTALAAAGDPAVTTDGCRILVAANVTSVDDAAAAFEQGADGSGLVRTEVLFGHHASLPDVEEQASVFREIAAAMGGAAITVRTWDVGGDKPLPFLPQPREANPFLGERGLRLVRSEPQPLLDQLKAVCLVARETPVHVMFPMVSTLAEVGWAREQLARAAREASGGIPDGLKVGIMVEVPAAAIRAGRLAGGLDFVSIGTNDLTQYTMAAERGNAAVAWLADACDPAVLELIQTVCTTVGPETTVAVCGDLASDPAAAVLLTGLGVRELSVVGAQVPLVKARLRQVSLGDAEALAGRALAAASAAEVRELIAELG